MGEPREEEVLRFRMEEEVHCSEQRRETRINWDLSATKAATEDSQIRTCRKDTSFSSPPISLPIPKKESVEHGINVVPFWGSRSKDLNLTTSPFLGKGVRAHSPLDTTSKS